MKKAVYKRYSTSILFLLFFPQIVNAANVYIDLDWTGTESGTIVEPYNSVTDLTPAASDDYYFRCGSSETLGSSWIITATGASDNYIVFGAYYDSGNQPPGTAPAGSAVIESDSPNFGESCGDSRAKPELRRATTGNTLIGTASGGSQYIEFNSMKFTTHAGVYLKSNYNKVRYCYVSDTGYAFRIGQTNAGGADGDYNIIEYNYVDVNDQTDEDGVIDGDCFELRTYAQNNIVQYNHCTGYDHGGVQIYGGDFNIVQYNYFFEKNGHEDFCFGHNANSNSNIIRFNYCKDAGMGHEIMGGNNNEIYGNVYTCGGGSHPASYGQGCIQFQSELGSNTSMNNKFYNNVIYDNNDHARGYGIAFVSISPDVAEVSGNQIYNNIILDIAQECIWIYDEENVVDTNYFYNNSCYNWNEADDGSPYASIEGSNKTCTQLNAEAYASDNIETNPSLNNPASYQLWPDSEEDDVVGAGYDLGDPYDDLLDPDNTDLNASPPYATLESQPASWIIGAYGVVGDTIPPAKPTGLDIIE